MAGIKLQMEELSEDMSFAEDTRIRALQDDEGGQIINSEMEEQFINARLQTFNHQVTATRIELSSLEGTIAKLRTLKQQGRDLMTLAGFAADPALMEMHSTKISLEQQLEAARVDLGPSHPDFEKQEAALTKVKGGISDKICQIVATKETELQFARNKENYLEVT